MRRKEIHTPAEMHTIERKPSAAEKTLRESQQIIWHAKLRLKGMRRKWKENGALAEYLSGEALSKAGALVRQIQRGRSNAVSSLNTIELDQPFCAEEKISAWCSRVRLGLNRISNTDMYCSVRHSRGPNDGDCYVGVTGSGIHMYVKMRWINSVFRKGIAFPRRNVVITEATYRGSAYSGDAKIYECKGAKINHKAQEAKVVPMLVVIGLGETHVSETRNTTTLVAAWRTKIARETASYVI